jgi:hypothetical protein
MSPDLDNALCRKYPRIFSLRHQKSTPSLRIQSGFEVGDGWFTLIDGLCHQLQQETDRNGAPQLEAVQVKEKYAELRFYVVSNPSDRQQAMIQLARELSLHTCEVCGAPGQMGKRGSHYSTRCAVHRTPDTVLDW